MKGFKRVICLMAAASMLAGVCAGCGEDKKQGSDDPKEFTEKKPEDYKGEITVWHFNKDDGPKMKKRVEDAYPNLKVNLQIISDKDQGYQNKLTQAIQSGTDVPDVIMAESAFVKRFVTTNGFFADLSEEPFDAESLTKKMVPATVDIGRDDSGKIRALSYQVTPGAIGYKRDLAKKYLGTDDPDKVSEMISTPEKMLDVAKKLKEDSNGKVKFFASQGDMFKIYNGARENGWVVDNKLVIDPMLDKYIDAAKTYRDEGYETGFNMWEQPWAASFKDDTTFGYAIPTWGIPYIIGANDPEAAGSGKWGLAQSPVPYTWGGTWMGVYAQSKNKELAWQFVKCICGDAENMKSWGEEVGDFMNNTDIIDDIAANGKDNDIIGQNPYAVFKPSLDKINGKLLTKYDDRIEAAFTDATNNYLNGKATKEELYKTFKEKVKSDFPELTVE